MKKVRAILLGVLIMGITAAELAACVPNRKDCEEQAVQMLEDKYQETFSIESYLGQDSMDGYYKVLAFSEEHPEILFQAKAAFDGSYLLDEYVSARVCASAGNQIERNLGGLPGYLEVKVQAVSKSIDSADPDISMQEFMELKSKNRFAVYMVYNPQGGTAGEIYNTIRNTFSGLECMSGNVQFYVTDEKVLRRTQEYLKSRAGLDAEFDEVLDNKGPVTIPFEKGRVLLTEQEFIRMAGDNL